MPGEDPENNKELVDKLLAYDPDSETMTPIEARKLVHRSGMILVPRWDIERSFVLDQMRRKDKENNYDTKTLAIWSISPDTKKPRMMDIEETT